VNWLRTSWQWLRELYAVLALIRFSILIPAVLVATLLAADQMADALIAASEHPLGGSTWAFLGATLFAALVVWYTARTMFRFGFADNPASDADVHPALKRHLPRLLALCVPTAVLIKVLTLSRAVADSTGVYQLAAALSVVLLLAALYVYGRRRIAQLPHLSALAEPEAQEARNLDRLSHLPPRTRRLLWTLAAANVAALLLAIYGPLYVIGAPALLLLALGLIAVMGSWLVYLANHHRIPILTLLLLWVILISPFNDNHAVRQTTGAHSHGVLARADPIAPSTLEASPLPEGALGSYFLEWWDELASRDGGSGPLPVVIVAADGGGIRAAYWTAIVLGELEDRSTANPVPFSRHVFAISGVSGGSLGAATFAAIAAQRLVLPPPSPARSWVQEADAVLGRDFLSPTMANALFPDLLQRFVPVPLFDDRAISLEQSWERAWGAAHVQGRSAFSAPFHSLWVVSPHSVPLLFLNGTVVESGQRSIMDPLATAPHADEPFSSTLRAGQVLGTQLPLSTAVLLSARFTYVSPAGLLGTGGPDRNARQRIVDGGYFDNSGGVTAQEIMRAISTAHRERTRAAPATRPMRLILIHIRNSPPNPRPARFTTSVLPEGYVWLSETLSPVHALLNTGPARAGQIMSYLNGSAGSDELTFYDIKLYRDRTDLPLGWALSCAVQQEMERQLTDCGADDCASHTIPRILTDLYGAAAPRPSRTELSTPICLQ